MSFNTLDVLKLEADNKTLFLMLTVNGKNHTLLNNSIAYEEIETDTYKDY